MVNSSYLASLVGGIGVYDALSPRSDGNNAVVRCICGLPMRMDQETCD